MKTLVLAPQPFFVERGTPIAVRSLVEALSRRGWSVDILAFHEGSDMECKNVRVFRIPKLSWITNIPPGLSFKKVVCDIFLFFKAISMVRHNRYDYVHAVEESVFIAMVIRAFAGVPFVYDMDSSMPEQIAESRSFLEFLLPLMRAFEYMAFKRAKVVIPVCDALADIARKGGAERLIILRDPPAFSKGSRQVGENRQVEFNRTGTCFMYIGNLEKYQGIDLLLKGFALAIRKGANACLAVIGGVSGDVDKYKAMCVDLGIEKQVSFLGPKPVQAVNDYVVSADVLVSPRIKGVNTPMKLYAYLNSGKAILATKVSSHTQVLSPDMAELVLPEPEAFAEGIIRLSGDSSLRVKLAEDAGRIAGEKYSSAAFERTVFEFCGMMESIISA